MERSPGPSRFLRGVGILAGGTALGQLIALATMPVLTRLFDPSNFGVLAVYVAVLGIVSTVGSWRLEQAIGLHRSQQVAFNVLSLAVVVAILSALIVGTIAASCTSFQRCSAAVPEGVPWVLPIGVLFACVYQALSVWALRTHSFGTIATTRVAQGFGVAASQVTAGVFGWGAPGLIGGHTLGQSVGISTLATRIFRGARVRRPRLRELRAALYRYRRFPMLAAPAALLNSASLQIPVLVLPLFFGAGWTGQFFLAWRITLAPLDLVGRSVGQVFYADAVRAGRSNPRQLRSLVLATSAKSFAIGLLPGLVIFFFAPFFFGFVFGTEWEAAGILSQALSILLIANFAVSPVSQVFLIVERQGFSVAVNAAKIMVSIISIGGTALLGFSAKHVVLTYSLAMGAYYLAVLAVALLLLRRMDYQKRAKGIHE